MYADYNNYGILDLSQKLQNLLKEIFSTMNRNTYKVFLMLSNFSHNFKEKF
jgi:hypothetical protein